MTGRGREAIEAPGRAWQGMGMRQVSVQKRNRGMRQGRLAHAAACVLAVGAAVLIGSPAAAEKKVPYWAAISKDEARMRVGPSMDYPANWIYRRRNLPVKVIETYPNWRKVEDPDGTKGWMHVRLLKDDQTAIVTHGTTEMRRSASTSAPVAYRVEQGVVGNVSNCDGDWCAFETGGRKGYVAKSHLWGATTD